MSDGSGCHNHCFNRRWAVETTYEEARAHLGTETQRQCSDPAIFRTTPVRLGRYSVVTPMCIRMPSAWRSHHVLPLGIQTGRNLCRRDGSVRTGASKYSLRRGIGLA